MPPHPDLDLAPLSPSARALATFVRNRHGTFAQLAADLEEISLLQQCVALSLGDRDRARHWDTASELLDAAIGPLHDAEQGA